MGLRITFAQWTGLSERPLLFKQRLLRKLDWEVLCVPYFKWGRLQSTLAQDEYLTRQLADLQDGRSGCLEESIFIVFIETRVHRACCLLE
jgi:hypothetical protein